MLELFANEIPRLDELSAVLNSMIHDSQFDLEDIRETISDHILDDLDDDRISEAHSIALNVVDVLIDEFEETETNYKRIRKYISSYHSYIGFNRLIVDFQRVVPDGERQRLMDKGRCIFRRELTDHWE